jgi:hypothetical protein
VPRTGGVFRVAPFPPDPGKKFNEPLGGVEITFTAGEEVIQRLF